MITELRIFGGTGGTPPDPPLINTLKIKSPIYLNWGCLWNRAQTNFFAYLYLLLLIWWFWPPVAKPTDSLFILFFKSLFIIVTNLFRKEISSQNFERPRGNNLRTKQLQLGNGTNITAIQNSSLSCDFKFASTIRHFDLYKTNYEKGVL